MPLRQQSSSLCAPFAAHTLSEPVSSQLLLLLPPPFCVVLRSEKVTNLRMIASFASTAGKPARPCPHAMLVLLQPSRMTPGVKIPFGQCKNHCSGRTESAKLMQNRPALMCMPHLQPLRCLSSTRCSHMGFALQAQAQEA